MKKIGVLGLWHLGSVYAACLANEGYEVKGFDSDKSVIKNLQNSRAPILEPGLEELIKSNLNKNLQFVFNPKDAIENKNYVFITLDIPVNNKDQVQMKDFYKLSDLIKKYISPQTILVISSQVPVGTCRSLKAQLKNEILYFPENLRLGQAIEGFLKPDRIVLGGSEKARKEFISDFSFFNCLVIEMSLESAEMSKHALNSYLALMISFASEIGDLCEKLGADANDVASALKSDQRVSSKAPLSPGLGFAGGTLGRDLQTLKKVSKEIAYNPKLVTAAYNVNLDRLPYLVKKISETLGSLKERNIGLLGLTYKPNTNTLRRSQSVELALLLKRFEVNVRAIDPAINGSEKEVKLFKISKEYDDFFKDLDAVILMTGWEEFKALKPEDFSQGMKQKIIFDTRNFLDKKIYENDGFLYVGIGDGISQKTKDPK